MVTFSACALACVLSGAGASNVVLLEFSADWCGPCRSVQPTVQRLVADGYPIQLVNIDREPQLAAQYRVTSVPCFVMVVGGQEVERVLGAASYARLTEMFQRAGQGAAPRGTQIAQSNSPTFVRGQSPEEGPRFGLPRPLASLAKGFGNRGAARRQGDEGFNPVQIDTRNQVSANPNDLIGAPADQYASAANQHSAIPNIDSQAPRGLPSAAGSIEQAMRATVRLRIEDATGSSVGTGTIIDSHGSEALVATCGHIFRDSQGKGRIVVDLFVDNQPRSVEGSLISYDLSRDIALVAIHPGITIAPARVAPAGFRLAAGQPVFSIGCDKGANPSPRESTITAIDRYLGSPNLEVAGMPVDGRSGGGLFSADGLLIGVCNAADPEKQEGIFASLPIIHWELDKVGQRKIYDPQSIMLASAASRTTRPTEMPNANRASQPTAPANSPASMELAATNMMPREMQGAGIVQDAPGVLRTRSDDTEVICIVRSKSNAQISQQLMVLDRPSRELMDRLKSESQRRTATGVASNERLPSPSPTIRAQSNDR